MYYATKTNLKKLLYSLKAITREKGDENQIYHLHIKNTLSFIKKCKI
jgi:hypothetical protein